MEGLHGMDGKMVSSHEAKKDGGMWAYYLTCSVEKYIKMEQRDW